MIPAIIAAACVAAVLYCAVKARIVVNDRPPSPVDRLAAWEIKMGQHRAQERLRQHSSRLAFDSRATVQPKVTPKLPR